MALSAALRTLKRTMPAIATRWSLRFGPPAAVFLMIATGTVVMSLALFDETRRTTERLLAAGWDIAEDEITEAIDGRAHATSTMATWLATTDKRSRKRWNTGATLLRQSYPDIEAVARLGRNLGPRWVVPDDAVFDSELAQRLASDVAQACRTGQAVLSAPTAGRDGQADTIHLVTPVPGRLDCTHVVVARFRVARALEASIAEVRRLGFGTTVHDDQGALVFDDAKPTDEAAWSRTLPITVAGRTWTLRTTPDGPRHDLDHRLATIVLTGGILVAILGGLLVSTMQTTRESRAILEDFIETAVVAIQWTTPEGTILRANRAQLDLLGYTAEEYVGRKAHTFFADPERALTFAQGVAGGLRAGRSYRTVRARLRAKDGSVRDVLIDVTARLHHGGLHHVRMFTRDITEQVRTFAMFQRFFALSQDLMTVVNADGEVIMHNDAAAVTLGKPQEDGETFRFIELVHPDDRVDTQATFDGMLGGQSTRGYRMRVRIADGTYRTFDWNATPLAEVGLVYAVGRDIAAQVEAEADRERARVAAEAASLAKTSFLANTSHELRTPLTAMLGYVELLADRDVTTEERRLYADTVRRNGEHLLAIITDVLDLSKIEAGKIAVEHLPCSPAQILADVVALLRVRATGKGLTLGVAYAPPLPATITTDPTRLRQILLNVVGNAIKFTETGDIRVTTGLVTPNGHPRLQYTVADTGIGMSSDEIARAFEPFSQADPSTTRRFGGTGLGLAISQRLARLLGGDVAIASGPGAGTHVTITIDPGPLDGVTLLDHPETAIVVAPSPAGDDLEVSIPLSGRILLAEDGPDNQRLLALHLRQAGAEVTVAANGREACDLADEAVRTGCPFDVVLMDMQMPILDGFAATRRLRAAGHRMPILALTAYATDVDRDRCLDAGCDAFVTKPISRRALLEVVRRHAGTAPPRAARLRSTLAGDAEVDAVIARFVTQLGTRVSAIRDCLARGDHGRAAALVHQLKGAAGSYGFPAITEACRLLEDATRDGADAAAIAEHLEYLTTLCARAAGDDHLAV